MRARIVKVLFIFLGAVFCLELALQLAHLLAPDRSGSALVADPSAAVILCLGDSHTYGAGVSREEAYPARLEAKLTARGYRVKVVNLGAPGYNTSQLRRHLPGWLKTYSPAAIIILAGVNNGWNRKDTAWADAADGLPVPMRTRVADFLTTRIRIIRGLNILVHRLDWTRPPEERARDRSGRPIIHHREESPAVEPPDMTYDRARRDLAAMVATAKAYHAVPLLMTYTTDPEYTFETPNLLLREVAATMKVALADNDKALRALYLRPDNSMDRAAHQELFLPDMHPKAKGYDRISDNIIQTLDRAGVTDLLPRD